MELQAPSPGSSWYCAPPALILISTSRPTGNQWRRILSVFEPRLFVSVIHTPPDISITSVSALMPVSGSNGGKSPATRRTLSLAPGLHMWSRGSRFVNIFLNMPTKMRLVILFFLERARNLQQIDQYMFGTICHRAREHKVFERIFHHWHCMRHMLPRECSSRRRRSTSEGRKVCLRLSISHVFSTNIILDMPTSTTLLFGAPNTTLTRRRWLAMMSCASGRSISESGYSSSLFPTLCAWMTRLSLGWSRNFISPPTAKNVAQISHSITNLGRVDGIWKDQNEHGSVSKVVDVLRIRGPVFGATLWTTSSLIGTGPTRTPWYAFPFYHS